MKKIAAIPYSFGSVDIINENLAALNTSNLRQKFSPDDHLIICIGRTHGSAGTDIGFALADKLKINYYDAEIFDQVLKKMDAEKEDIEDHSNYVEELKGKIAKKTGVGKRIFRMAPLHHHFELGGWSEKRGVAVFAIVTALLCMLALLGL